MSLVVSLKRALELLDSPYTRGLGHGTYWEPGIAAQHCPEDVARVRTNADRPAHNDMEIPTGTDIFSLHHAPVVKFAASTVPMAAGTNRSGGAWRWPRVFRGLSRQPPRGKAAGTLGASRRRPRPKASGPQGRERHEPPVRPHRVVRLSGRTRKRRRTTRGRTRGRRRSRARTEPTWYRATGCSRPRRTRVVSSEVAQMGREAAQHERGVVGDEIPLRRPAEHQESPSSQGAARGTLPAFSASQTGPTKNAVSRSKTPTNVASPRRRRVRGPPPRPTGRASRSSDHRS